MLSQRPLPALLAMTLLCGSLVAASVADACTRLVYLGENGQVVTASGRCTFEGSGYAPEGAVRADGGVPLEGALRVELEQALAVASRANNATVRQRDGRWMVEGDPTEGALLVAARKCGLGSGHLEQQLPRVGEVPFSSERKLMSTIHRDTGREGAGVVFTKGAPDVLLGRCAFEAHGDGWRPLTDERRAEILRINDALAGQALRTLGVAARWLDGDALTHCADHPDERVEQGLVFAGLVGMIDPPRPEAGEAVARARSAGIRPIMITGDHPLTALSIARELGITKGDKALTGKDLANMTVDELQSQVEDVQVFARVSPEHKLKIVEALQNLGHNVAMTGDGVNDAPALKRADIGVAMGITGTDVSKEAADMVLLDDNFTTIVAAVEEGRRIYDNIRKFVRYTLASNSGEILVMLAAPFLGMPLPLTPLQILWVNLVTDGLPGLALTVESAEPSTMRRPPHAPNESIFARGLAKDVVWIGALLAVLSLAGGILFWRAGSENWQTVIFTTLVLAQMGNVMALRSERASVFKIGFFSNKYMIGAVVLMIVLQMAVIYLPFMQNVFETRPLNAAELAVSFGLGLVLFIVAELVKWLRRRGGNKS